MGVYYEVTMRGWRNADLRDDFRLTEADLTTGVDLTGATLKLDIVDRAGTRVSCTTGNGRIVVTDAAGGYFRIDIPQSVMTTLVAGKCDLDLIKTQSGATDRLIAGTLTLENGVTA